MCGIAGIFSSESNAPALLKPAMESLQGRGQEGAGIAVQCGGDIERERELGYVNEVFRKNLAMRESNIAIGHTWYSTTAVKHKQNLQPFLGTFRNTPFALAHNGNLVNAEELETLSYERGLAKDFYSSTSDSERIAGMLVSSPAADFIDALKNDVLPKLKGSFSLVILFKENLIGTRDQFGIRPLILGAGANFYLLASESAACNPGAQFVRDIQPGEICIINQNGITKDSWYKPNSHFCIFEYAYFARPDSRLEGHYVHHTRIRLGEKLAESEEREADLVISIPDSGNSASLGFYQTLARRGKLEERFAQIAYDPFAIFTSHYRHPNQPQKRNFIQPDPAVRFASARKKFTVMRRSVHGKRLFVIDDSIVRGDTSRELTKMLREAGAREIHWRIPFYPILHPCHLGIDMPTYQELKAATVGIEALRRYIEANSIKFLTPEDVHQTIDPDAQFCMGCGTGNYPVDRNGIIAIS